MKPSALRSDDAQMGRRASSWHAFEACATCPRPAATKRMVSRSSFATDRVPEISPHAPASRQMWRWQLEPVLALGR